MTEAATIRATIKRARDEGVGISETGLRRLLPCRARASAFRLSHPEGAENQEHPDGDRSALGDSGGDEKRNPLSAGSRQTISTEG